MPRIVCYKDLKPGDKFDFNGNHCVVSETGVAVVNNGPGAGQLLTFPDETPIDILDDDTPEYRRSRSRLQDSRRLADKTRQGEDLAAGPAPHCHRHDNPLSRRPEEAVPEGE